MPSELTMMNECYSCRHKRSVPGNSHIQCIKPDPLMVGDRHGVTHHWFIYPSLFDPVWKRVWCANFESKPEDPMITPG